MPDPLSRDSTPVTESPVPSFSELGLSEPILEALAAVGYESPSPIQAQTIPVLLKGTDVLGQAQTGTGKTAAFALPLLSQIDLNRAEPQALVLGADARAGDPGRGGLPEVRREAARFFTCCPSMADRATRRSSRG